MPMSTLLLLTGMSLLIAMQIAIFVVALSKYPTKAILCLFIPFYVYVFAQREPKAKPYLLAWYAGMVLLVVGVIAAS